MTRRKNVIVVVDGDAWVHRALAAVVSGDEFDVVPCTTARGALNACCALDPSCVVVELDLADETGIWFATELRKEPSQVAVVPIIVTSVRKDEAPRVEALNSGIDVFVPKPLHILELVAQVKALVSMAARFQGERTSILPPSGIDGRPRAIMGDLERMSVATVLGALELERRSGDLVLRGATRKGRLTLEIASGALVGGRRDGFSLRAIDALRAALTWEGRRFEFVPGPERHVPDAEPFGALVIAAITMNEAEMAKAASTARPGKTTGWQAFPTPTGRSGTRAKVTPPPLPSATRPMAPGSRLVESMAPGTRSDPRAEPDDATTMRIAGRR